MHKPADTGQPGPAAQIRIALTADVRLQLTRGRLVKSPPPNAQMADGPLTAPARPFGYSQWSRRQLRGRVWCSN